MSKRVIVLLVLAVLVIVPSAFAGAQRETAVGLTATVNPRGTFPIVDQPITVTAYREASLTAEQLAALADNGVLQLYAQETNINLEFVHLNPQEGKTQMTLAFAAGNYPEAAFLSWNTMLTRDDVVQFGTREGIVVPLNDYIDQYAHELEIIFELRPNHRAILTAPDGNIYGIPRFTECYHCMSYPKLWFNYGWLEEMGLDEPQTTDELHQVLRAFKARDRNVVPLTGNVEWSSALEYYLMNSFIYTDAASTSTSPRPFLSWIDGRVTFVAARPEWREGLTWMKQLYDEGLIDPGNFTQNNEGMQQLIRQEPLIVGGYTSDHIGMGVDFWNDPDTTDMFHALPPVAGPRGVRYQPYWDSVSQLGGFSFVLFDRARNPAATFRFADYLLSEYNMFVGHYGVEGIGWNAPDDPNARNLWGGPLKAIPVSLPSDAPQAEIDRLNNNRLWLGLIGDIVERRAMWTPEPTPEVLRTSYEARIQWETLKTEPYWPDVVLPRALFMESDVAAEFTDLKLNLVNHVLSNTARFITGARSLTEWDTYVGELRRFGMDRYVEIYAEAYDDFLALSR